MALLGWWLDKIFNTSPTLIIIFSLFGVLAGMVSFFRTVLNINKKNKGSKID
jgi:F0F1-type ATP synthase assembly protein I